MKDNGDGTPCVASIKDDMKYLSQSVTTCTVYYEAAGLRYSVEKDFNNYQKEDCNKLQVIEGSIKDLFDVIKSKHCEFKIKTILFSEVNELPCEVINE